VKIDPGRLRTVNCRNLLDEDDTQSQKMLADQLDISQAAISMQLHAMGKVQKIGKWVPHELNDKHGATPKYMPNSACQTKRKSFLHRIVTNDEKWIYFQNP